jgi:hypothetical protein
MSELDNLRVVLARQFDEIVWLKGEAGVLRGLLRQALAVIETIDDEESDEWMMLAVLKTKMEAAICGVPT